VTPSGASWCPLAVITAKADYSAQKAFAHVYGVRGVFSIDGARYGVSRNYVPLCEKSRRTEPVAPS
jgi:hypothetical protein